MPIPPPGFAMFPGLFVLGDVLLVIGETSLSIGAAPVLSDVCARADARRDEAPPHTRRHVSESPEDQMPVVKSSEIKLEDLREMVADVLERQPHEIADAADFQKEYDADSLRAIEILSRIEKKYGIDVPQTELPLMRTLLDVCDIVTRYTAA